MIIQTAPAPLAYSDVLQKLTAAGWEVVTDGPSGAQLRGKKKMAKNDVGAAVLGAGLMLFSPALGAFLIIIAVLDFLLLTKPPMHFLSRESPELPRPEAKDKGGFIKRIVISVLVISALVAAMLLLQ